MVLNFYVAFRSLHGQSLFVKMVPAAASEFGGEIELPLQFLNESYWHLSLKTSELPFKDECTYSYIFRDINTGEVKEFCKHSLLNFKKLKHKRFNIIDEWRDANPYENVFSSKPFSAILNQAEKVKVTDSKNPTHIFRVTAPALAGGKVVCITGAGKKLKDWDTSSPLMMERKGDVWQIRLNLSKEKFPLAYKLGIYDLRLQTMQYESGDDRRLPEVTEKDSITLLQHSLNTAQDRWRAAGVNVQLSSLKTATSWGVGDFTDLNELTNWTKAVGMRMIQLLPINDTTSTHTDKDSYPYSAVSAFALHPVYLNVQKLANALGVKFEPNILQQAAALNAKPSLHYSEVVALKLEAIKILFEKDKASFKDDFDWFAFFELNRHWLVPYAAYCYLRNKNKTADYNTWQQYADFDEAAIQDLVSPDNDFYDEIAIHYYTQYHLHLQLKDAVDYAHKAGVIIKGDLPIGVGRYSADAWMYRSLFHMDMQAGAPPDAFATKGQNWSFPT
ncbi:MAG: 4-alpha-glucanotransferase, partial [Chitinophagaceae bacterium]